METPGPQDGGQLPRSLTNHVAHGQFAIEGDAEQFKGVTVRLGVGHDVHGGLLRGVKRDLVRSTPIVQLG